MPVSLETLDLVLRTHAAERPEKVALRAGDRVWSYPELHSESARVANALLEAGVGPQERVAFLDRNVPEYFTLLFGAAMINGVMPVGPDAWSRRPRAVATGPTPCWRWPATFRMCSGMATAHSCRCGSSLRARRFQYLRLCRLHWRRPAGLSWRMSSRRAA